MLMREKEIDNIESAGDLRAALADVPDDMPLGDGLHDGLLLRLVKDDAGKDFIEVR
jgi:hypothetical protein